jgi:hypothetical protein
VCRRFWAQQNAFHKSSREVVSRILLTISQVSTHEYYKYSRIASGTAVSYMFVCNCTRMAYAAVAANSSARRALVSSPTLPANKVVNVAMRPNLQSGDVTLYKTTMAPIKRSAARKVLNHATKELMARSEA